MYGGIETGGTKTVCAIGSNGTIVRRGQFPTGDDPEALAGRCGDFFADEQVVGLGVGTFGPCDPDPESATYGHILATPKPGWANTDLLGLLRRVVDAPMVMTTDVTAAAIGERQHGAGRGCTDLVYVTIGTGIGGGVIVGGRPLHGAQHPEVGHMLLPFELPGVCPFHRSCWEGLASGPALAARLTHPATELADDDPAWDLEARIVAAGMHNLTMTLSPQMIIVGGGVGSREALHRRLPDLLTRSLGGYVAMPQIRRPGLGADAGVIGALTMAESCL